MTKTNVGFLKGFPCGKMRWCTWELRKWQSTIQMVINTDSDRSPALCSPHLCPLLSELLRLQQPCGTKAKVSSSAEHLPRQPSSPGLNKMTQSIWYSLGSHTGTCPFWDVPHRADAALARFTKCPWMGLLVGGMGSQSPPSPPPPPQPLMLLTTSFALIMNSNRNFYSQFHLDSLQIEILHLVYSCKFKRLKIVAFTDNGLFYF